MRESDRSSAQQINTLLLQAADRSHGVLSVAELRALGLTDHVVGQRVRAGWLRRLHRGVYLVGRRTPTEIGRVRAAVCAVGAPAAASGPAGTALWGLSNWIPPTIDVVTTRQVADRPGIRIRRTRWLPSSDVADRDGVAVLCVDRLLAEVAASGDARRLERLWKQAERERLIDRGAVARHVGPGLRGSRLLRARLADDSEVIATENDLEARLAEIIAAAGLPQPRREEPVGPFFLDFFWPQYGLCVETDGFRDHGSRAAFARDRRRDARLLAHHGIRTVRFTWTDVMNDGPYVAATLRGVVI